MSEEWGHGDLKLHVNRYHAADLNMHLDCSNCFGDSFRIIRTKDKNKLRVICLDCEDGIDFPFKGKIPTR